MKIYCTHCGKYLGEIRDATLMKNIHYICGKCRIKDLEKESTANNFFVDYLKDIMK